MLANTHPNALERDFQDDSNKNIVYQVILTIIFDESTSYHIFSYHTHVDTNHVWGHTFITIPPPFFTTFFPPIINPLVNYMYV